MRVESLQFCPIVEQEANCKSLSELKFLPLRSPTTFPSRLEREGLEKGPVC